MTLIEVLIAAGIFAVISTVLVLLLGQFVRWNQTLAIHRTSTADLFGLTDRLKADEAGAEAIFVPQRDVFGADNSSVHEIDFYARDAARHPFFWAYYWDGKNTMQRYNYANPGSKPVADGNPYTQITKFIATEHDDIADIMNPESDIYAPIFASAERVNVRVGYQEMRATKDPNDNGALLGGNGIVHLDIGNSYDETVVELETGTAPGNYTVIVRYTPAPQAEKCPNRGNSFGAPDGKCYDLYIFGTLQDAHGGFTNQYMYAKHGAVVGYVTTYCADCLPPVCQDTLVGAFTVYEYYSLSDSGLSTWTPVPNAAGFAASDPNNFIFQNVTLPPQIPPKPPGCGVHPQPPRGN